MSIQDRIESEEATEELGQGCLQSADLSQSRGDPVGVSEGSDHETIFHVEGEEWRSEVGHEEFIDSESDDEIPFWLVSAATSRTAFRFIPTVNLVEVFQERACVMKSVPRFLTGPYRLARTALEKILAGCRGPGCGTRGERMEVVHASSPQVVAQTSQGRRDPEIQIA